MLFKKTAHAEGLATERHYLRLLDIYHERLSLLPATKRSESLAQALLGQSDWLVDVAGLSDYLDLKFKLQNGKLSEPDQILRSALQRVREFQSRRGFLGLFAIAGVGALLTPRLLSLPPALPGFAELRLIFAKDPMIGISQYPTRWALGDLGLGAITRSGNILVDLVEGFRELELLRQVSGSVIDSLTHEALEVMPSDWLRSDLSTLEMDSLDIDSASSRFITYGAHTLNLPSPIGLDYAEKRSALDAWKAANPPSNQTRLIEYAHDAALAALDAIKTMRRLRAIERACEPPRQQKERNLSSLFDDLENSDESAVANAMDVSQTVSEGIKFYQALAGYLFPTLPTDSVPDQFLKFIPGSKITILSTATRVHTPLLLGTMQGCDIDLLHTDADLRRSAELLIDPLRDSYDSIEGKDAAIKPTLRFTKESDPASDYPQNLDTLLLGSDPRLTDPDIWGDQLAIALRRLKPDAAMYVMADSAEELVTVLSRARAHVPAGHTLEPDGSAQLNLIKDRPVVVARMKLAGPDDSK